MQAKEMKTDREEVHTLKHVLCLLAAFSLSVQGTGHPRGRHDVSIIATFGGGHLYLLACLAGCVPLSAVFTQSCSLSYR